VSEEWPRERNGPGSEIRNNPSSLVEKNVADNPLLILRVDILSDLTDVSERFVNAYAIIIVLCISIDKSIIRTRSLRNTHSQENPLGEENPAKLPYHK
jgi:hypothetical protein